MNSIEFQNSLEMQRNILDELCKNGIVVTDQPFALGQWEHWRNLCEERFNQGKFQRSQIGRANQRQLEPSIRGDSILWIEKTDPEMQYFWEWIRQFQELAKNEYFIPTRSSEFHFAVYPKGSRYEKHRDQSTVKGSEAHQLSKRVMTFICYLNTDWKIQDGGRLHVLPQAEVHEQVAPVIRDELYIEPQGGRVVFFFSESLLHEVELCHANRMSLTGWFRNDLENN